MPHGLRQAPPEDESREPGSVRELTAAAAGGDARAWEQLVRRYLPLVTSIAARFRLDEADIADVSQTLWLRLVQHLGDLREPEALPGWIATTTRHECVRVLRGRSRSETFDPLTETPDGQVDTEVDPAEDLLRTERREALLAGLAELSDRHRELLLLLLHDPPPSYAEIGALLGMPVGAIGPTRARALLKLRRSPALAALHLDGAVVEPPRPRKG